MIMQNPIFKRESMVTARNFKFAFMLLIFNGILAVVALLNMYSTLSQINLTAEIQYTSFLDLYMFVAILEFIMLLFFMPALTAGSISGEKEKRTLELMLTTNMTPTQIVIGKMMSSLSTMLLMVISSFPIFAMVFVYGGVTAKDVGTLLLCYIASAVFVGSIGICCSCILKKTTIAMIGAYGMTGFMILGTYGMNQLTTYTGQITSQMGVVLRFLQMNPATTFVVTMMQLLGPSQRSGIAGLLGNQSTNGFLDNWIIMSVVVQFIVSMGLIWLSVYAISPKKKRFGKMPV